MAIPGRRHPATRVAWGLLDSRRSMSIPQGEITRLLTDWSDGDPDALERLMPLVFDELRQIARSHFRRESAGHTLQPTALVNEVYLRLLGQRQVQWDNRSQFFSFAALLMRRILVDHAKGRKAAKRGGGIKNLPLEEALAVPAGKGSLDYVALDHALDELARYDPRQARIVELRYFVGLTQEEVAEVLDVSLTTIKRDWRMARLWLYQQMEKE